MADPYDRVEPVVPTAENGAIVEKRTSAALAFLRQLGIIVSIAVAASLALALGLGSFNALGIADTFFYATFVLLLLAVMPVFSEFGSSVLALGRAAAEQKSVRSLLEGKREEHNRGARRTYLYGAAGILMFVLSLLIASTYR